MAEIKNEFNLNPDDMFDGGMLHFTDTLDKRYVARLGPFFFQ